MAYLGSKAINAHHILEVLNDPVFDGMDYVEPFVGYGHILRRVENKASYTASDSNPLLITLLKAIQKNKTIPHVTRAEYDSLKHQTNNSLKRATAAFTYSYCGKCFGGYVDAYFRRSKRQSYAAERNRYYDTLRANPRFLSTVIRCSDYRELDCKNKLIYCDPPYADTTAYAGTESFDSHEFWNYVRTWSKDNFVFVSEYTAPHDFTCIATAQKKCTVTPTGRSVRTENVFIHNSALKRLKRRLQRH